MLSRKTVLLELCTNGSLGGLELYFCSCVEFFFRHSEITTFAGVINGSKPAQRLKFCEKSTSYFKSGRFSFFYNLWVLLRFIRDKEVTVVHIHHKKDIKLCALAKILSAGKLRLVFTRQMEMPGSKKGVFHNWAYQQIDVFLCITDRLRGQVLMNTKVDPKRVHRLYYGVEFIPNNKDRSSDFLKLFPSRERKIVSMLSRIDRGKGQLRLLKVLLKTPEQGRFQVYFLGHSMGDGYKEELERFVEENQLTDYVHWCGPQARPQELLSVFDVLVMPSDQETFGLVLIEAMASGVAVMASNTGGVPEIIEDGVNGFTFDPDDTNTFSDKLSKILSDEELRKSFIASSTDIVKERFALKAHFERLKEHLVR